MIKLFEDLCDIVFTLEDNSQILCQTTLNQSILKRYGWDLKDDFIDFLSNRIIPFEMFDYDFKIAPKNTVVLADLDRMFLNGGKVSWKLLY